MRKYGELLMPSCTEPQTPVRKVGTEETAELRNGSTDGDSP